MSKYRVGRDIQELRHRVEALETSVFGTSAHSNRCVPDVCCGINEPDPAIFLKGELGIQILHNTTRSFDDTAYVAAFDDVPPNHTVRAAGTQNLCWQRQAHHRKLVREDWWAFLCLDTGRYWRVAADRNDQVLCDARDPTTDNQCLFRIVAERPSHCPRNHQILAFNGKYVRAIWEQPQYRVFADARTSQELESCFGLYLVDCPAYPVDNQIVFQAFIAYPSDRHRLVGVHG